MPRKRRHFVTSVFDFGEVGRLQHPWAGGQVLESSVAGHRLSTGSMEEVLSEHPDVAECAVIGIADKLKGQMPVGLVVLKAGVTKSIEDIQKECVKMIRDRIGPVAAFKTAIVIKRLPKTRSGKVLRGTMRKIADKEEYKMPATIDDPAILTEITDSLKTAGIL